MSNNEKQLQQLQQENTVLKAQVYDLNVMVQNAQTATQQAFGKIVEALDIDVPDEGLSVDDIVSHIRALTSPESDSDDGQE